MHGDEAPLVAFEATDEHSYPAAAVRILTAFTAAIAPGHDWGL